MIPFDCIIWKDSLVVKGLFSLKNPAYGQEHTITGLNLGYNTPEKAEITQAHRNAWLEFAGADPALTATGRQVHHNHVEVVTKGGVYENTDGFVTSTPGMSLGIFVADCGGILLADEKNRVIGACHAGWKGAVLGIIPETIKKMVALGAQPETISAFVSPCISRKHFEVGEEVAEKFPEAFVDRSFAKPHVDLKGCIRQQLLDAGVSEQAIAVSKGCTVADADDYYSYRREGAQSGRMMALITLKRPE